MPTESGAVKRPGDQRRRAVALGRLSGGNIPEEPKVTEGYLPNFMLPLVGFKSRKAAQIVTFFALKSVTPNRGTIEKLKLIKLIYFSERESLKQHRLPMLFDEFYSLPHGPICSATLNGIDGKLDAGDEGIWGEYIARNGNVVVAMKRFARDSLDAIHHKEVRILNYIWHRFGGMTASQLRNYSHENCSEYTEITEGRIPISYREVMVALGFTGAEADTVDDNVRNIRRKESVPADVTVVSLLEYKRLEECVKNPAPPTQAVLEGAELLRSLRRSSR
jgi:uncharacterized phage-associated protein